MYFLYILRTHDNRLYIGITQDLSSRLARHLKGKGSDFTKVHTGAKLVYSEEYPDLSSARSRENQIKRWTRAKKEALIAGESMKLKALSQCKTTHPQVSKTANCQR